MARRSGRYDSVAPNISIQGCSSGGTPWVVSCPPSRSCLEARMTRRPRRTAASAPATPPRPPPTTRISVCCSIHAPFRFRVAEKGLRGGPRNVPPSAHDVNRVCSHDRLAVHRAALQDPNRITGLKCGERLEEVADQIRQTITVGVTGRCVAGSETWLVAGPAERQRGRIDAGERVEVGGREDDHTDETLTGRVDVVRAATRFDVDGDVERDYRWSDRHPPGGYANSDCGHHAV